ncbi:MAG: hypothetical protein Q4G59_06600, partial [Planctomycetia bacterium]|nr:hypothetical protein [Planctomycetia bacterium]
MKMMIHLLLVFGFLSGTVSTEAAVRESKTLDGTWRFSTDPAGIGEKEKWFEPYAKMLKMPLKGYGATANGTIQVPGIWTNQGYGDPFDPKTYQHTPGHYPWKPGGDVPTDMLKHQFIGKGWYKRTFTIPSAWQGQKINVVLGGISRYAKIWINGQSAGPEAIGCIAPHEREITKLVRFDAENDITICVDSKQRFEIDTLYACSSMGDFMQLPWGGLWGHVSLEARPNVCLDSLYLRGNIQTSTCTAETTVLADTPVDKDCVLRLNIFDKTGKSVAQGESPVRKAGEKTCVSASIPNAILWSPDTPHLYDVQVSLLYKGKVIDR